MLCLHGGAVACPPRQRVLTPVLCSHARSQSAASVSGRSEGISAGLLTRPDPYALHPGLRGPTQWRCTARNTRRAIPARPAAATTATAASEGDTSTSARTGPLQAWREWWSLGSEDSKSDDNKLPQAAELASIWPKLWSLVVPDLKLLCIGAVFMFVAAFSELAIPQCMSSALFSLTKQGAQDRFSRSVKLLAAASISYGLFAAARGWVFSLVNTQMLFRLRQSVFERLTEQPMGFFETEEVGALTSRLGSDCQIIARLFSTTVNVALRNAVQMVAGAAYLCYLCPTLAGTTLGVTLLLWTVTSRYGAFSRQCTRAYQDRLADTNQVAEEVFGLISTVRAFGAEAREQARYSGCLAALRRLSMRAGAAYGMYLASNSTLYNLNKVITLFVGGLLLTRGAITGEQLMTFVLYVEAVDAASLAVCDQWGPFMEAIGASERILGYLDRPRAPQLAAGKILPNMQGVVQLQDVYFNYPSRPEEPALVDVTLAIPAGSTAALVGQSGSGKSTLVALIQRLYDVDRGQVLIDGVDVRELDASWFRKQVAVVDQNPRLFSTTVADNIAYGTEDATREDVVAAAVEANAHEFIRDLPQGYDTRVTTDLLSGGQRQRVALARALLRRPRLLILDEATSALDAHSEYAVTQALARATASLRCTVLVIAHRLSTVRSADLTVVMHEGRVAEVGTHTQLMGQGGRYAALVRRQEGLTPESRDMAPSERHANGAGPVGGEAVTASAESSQDSQQPDAGPDGNDSAEALARAKSTA